MQHIRPTTAQHPSDSWFQNIASNVNNGHLQGGQGVTIRRHGNATSISVTSPYLDDCMIYRGAYDYDNQYMPNDVVYVDPNATYVSNSVTIPIGNTVTSQSICPICAGLWICINYVGPSWQNKAYLTTSIGPAMTLAGGIVPDNAADKYRHENLNIYYPIYPSIPTSSIKRTTESTWTTVANQTFWAPLMPMVAMTVCVNNVTSTMYIGGVASGSFNTVFLPYTGSGV
jgi:hypothetical protein